jgi:hypothetical protein
LRSSGLISPARRVGSPGDDADDARGHIANLDVAPHRVGLGAEQATAGTAAEHRDCAGRADVTRLKELATSGPPAIQLRVRRVGAEDLQVFARRAVRDEAAQPHHARGVLHPGHGGNRDGVVGRQGRGGSEAGRDLRLLAAAGEVAGVHAHQVGPGRSHVVGHRLLRAGAERHHRDHRGDADRHPERGQRGAKLVAAERAQRDPQAVGHHS